ncbi:STAS domain-containing protein [Streptomyces sp. PTM05]|uniref:STAS domain-containing protein n=2 Tax=Streptantibioticus parmotrematis TaxID=2873249 RepID=A0ABS7QVJ7_9ACTN|nr:STAS domain-containing protein [Streptantibioticus parmotrematis]
MHSPVVAMAITSASGPHVVLTLTGELHTGRLQELEELLADPRLHEAQEWVLEMASVRRLDLACAYALLRAATRRPQLDALTFRGATRPVQRSLRDAGLGAVGTIEP